MQGVRGEHSYVFTRAGGMITPKVREKSDPRLILRAVSCFFSLAQVPEVVRTEMGSVGGAAKVKRWSNSIAWKNSTRHLFQASERLRPRLDQTLWVDEQRWLHFNIPQGDSEQQHSC